MQDLTVNVKAGEYGVTRLTYRYGGQVVGKARLLLGTIGDIEVKPAHRRKGFGLAILLDLIIRGGRYAICVTEESKGLFEKAGFVSADGMQYALPQ